VFHLHVNVVTIKYEVISLESPFLIVLNYDEKCTCYFNTHINNQANLQRSMKDS